MDETVKSQLNALLARKAQNEASAMHKIEMEANAEQEREAKKAAARLHWKQSVGEIREAISNLNERIRDADLELIFEEHKDQNNGPGIAQVTVGLRERGLDEGKKLVFNVSAFGLVQLVSLIRHTGPKIADFNIADAQVGHYETVMVEFLDQCFSEK